MRAVDPAAQALREARGGLAERLMLWIEARHRVTNAVEGLGLWTGEDTEEITALDLWTNPPRPGPTRAPAASSRSAACSTPPGSRCARSMSPSRRSTRR